jgi:hypothetical protein
MKTVKGTGLEQDVANVSAALRRAARQARKTAQQTRTPLVIYEDGRVKRKIVAHETK